MLCKEFVVEPFHGPVWSKRMIDQCCFQDKNEGENITELTVLTRSTELGLVDDGGNRQKEVPAVPQICEDYLAFF